MSLSHSTTDLQRMTQVELRKEIKTARSEAAKFRLSIELGAEKNHAQYRTMKRSIARMLTIERGMNKESQKKTSQVA